MESSTLLPPTSADLLLEDTHPYFLWWTDITVGQFRRRLRVGERSERAYWLGALLREANSRDVDLHCPVVASIRHLVRLVPDLARALGGEAVLVQDAGEFVRDELRERRRRRATVCGRGHAAC